VGPTVKPLNFQRVNSLTIVATNTATDADVPSARLGQRFGRMDLTSQLALLAVEPLVSNFESLARDRIAIGLAAQSSSLPTDVEYWKGRDNPGGPSPTLFTYTLPSAAIGEIAIRHRITGPNLCFVGGSEDVLRETADLIHRGEADGCLCVYVNVVSPSLAGFISSPITARACALFMQRGESDFRQWQENDRDMEALCATLRPKISTK
jgi:3-oxoacyl-(acyl-carrier-protein) synthase